MEPKKPRFQDYYDELCRGDAYGVFIDDTGSPGIKDAPENYHPERKSWVAVIVPPAHMPEVMQQMPRALRGLVKNMGASEFHFTDIYAGRRDFKNVDLQVRLDLFRFMASIFSNYKFPIIVQTFDPETLQHTRKGLGVQFPESIPHFDLTDCGDLALFFLLLRVKWYMREVAAGSKAKARVFIDEGFKKNGICLQMRNFENEFADGQVCFAQSSTIFPIQLADFAAFCLNRTQLIGGKNTRSAIDNEFLQITSQVAPNFLNIEKRVMSADHEGPLITLADTRPNGPFK